VDSCFNPILIAMYRLLIIEDEVKTAESIRQGLAEHDFQVDVAHDGAEGRDLACQISYDLIVTDRILPKINGIDVCRELRSRKIDTPILVLTALGSTDDKVEGLEAGADDYLCKPFEFKELLARVRALLKRGIHLNNPERSLKIADLEMGLDSKIVTRAGKQIELTAKEFSLLEFLLRNKGKVVSKADIAERVWGIHFDTGTNVVEVYVNYLRKKMDRDFEPKLIHTHIGLGYVMREE
jgi:two-component system, OmpR family, copper resistance phosphate regulon response regulator CusR